MARNRMYNCKDVEMLLAAKTIVQSLQRNLGDLSLAQLNWNEEFVNSLLSKIDNTMDNFLGIDPKKELRAATAQLAILQEPALRDLSFLKMLIEVHFEDDASKILKNLGFTRYYHSAQQKDQESLINLLFAFNKGINDKLLTKMNEQGINPKLIEKIQSYGNDLAKTNLTQETLKATSKEITDEAVENFMAIYDELIKICKVASRYYQNDPVKKDQFVFSTVVSNMSSVNASMAQDG